MSSKARRLLWTGQGGNNRIGNPYNWHPCLEPRVGDRLIVYSNEWPGQLGLDSFGGVIRMLSMFGTRRLEFYLGVTE